MVVTELIMGMEELVNHIKDIEEENKKLKEENKKLQEEKETLCKFIGGDYDEGDAVEEILKGYYSEDFINANYETWDYYQIFQ